MEILLILIVVFVILPSLSGWLLRAWLRRKVNRFNRQTRQGDPKDATSRPRQPRKKVFTQDDGEYVDFEEFSPTDEPPKNTPT